MRCVLGTAETPLKAQGPHLGLRDPHQPRNPLTTQKPYPHPKDPIRGPGIPHPHPETTRTPTSPLRAQEPHFDTPETPTRTP